MAGDSITAQRLHTNFIEGYYRTRFPNLNLQFRNSGIGGNTTGSVLARFGYDIADWKPAIVSIELGMNDVGAGDDPAKYIEGMRQLVKRVREIPATPLLISSSPVNDGSTLDVSAIRPVPEDSPVHGGACEVCPGRRRGGRGPVSSVVAAMGCEQTTGGPRTCGLV